MTLTVGQNLWWVPQNGRHSSPGNVTVVRVARKYAYLDNGYRIYNDSLMADGGQYSAPGYCYLSQEAYEHTQALNSAWSDLQRDVRYMREPGVTLEQIKEARRLLGLPT